MSTKHTGGRPPKLDPASIRLSIRFNSEDHAKFLSLYEQSGVYCKARFIVKRIFNGEFRALIIDKKALIYYTRLTEYHAQFREIGVNYNMTVVALKNNFSEKKALALLYKLEKMTIELSEINRKVIALTKELEEKFMQK